MSEKISLDSSDCRIIIMTLKSVLRRENVYKN